MRRRVPLADTRRSGWPTLGNAVWEPGEYRCSRERCTRSAPTGSEAVRALRDRTHLAVHAFAPPVRKARAYVLYDAVHVFLDRTTEFSEGLETTALRPSDPFAQPASRNVVLLPVQDAAQGFLYQVGAV